MTVLQDLAIGWRRLKATPPFTIVSVATVALGIAAVTTAVTLVRAAAAPPPGVPDVSDLLTLSHTRFGHHTHFTFSLGDFEDLRRRQTTMGDVIAFATSEQVIVFDGQSRTGLGEVVSGSYFQTLRVPAVLGRTIQTTDDLPGAPAVVMISHETWQLLFAGRSDVIGQMMTVGGHAFQVVGVASRDFIGLTSNGRYPVMTWTPLAQAGLFERFRMSEADDRNRRWLYLRARPLQAASVDQVAAEVTTIARQLDADHPIGTDLEAPYRLPFAVSREWVVRRSQDLLMDESATAIRPASIALLMVAVSLVLLVACSNLANLIMARLSVRRHELAVRIALGASRVRLVFSSMVEVLLIVAMGGVVALLLTWWLLEGVGGAFHAGRGIIFLLQPRMDVGAFTVALSASVVALLVSGMVPALVLTREHARDELLSGRTSTVVPRWRGRGVLIAAQAAVSIVLLGTAAMFSGQVVAAARFTGGIDLDRMAAAEVNLTLQNFDDARTSALVEQVLERIQRVLSVQEAAVSAGFPLRVGAPRVRIDTVADPVFASIVEVSPRFFDATDLAFVAGGALEPDAPGIEGAEPVVIDAPLAMRLFGGTDVIGQPLTFTPLGTDSVGERDRVVVGVVEAVEPDAVRQSYVLYVPFQGRSDFPLVFLARTSGEPARIADELRRALRETEPAIGVAGAGSGRAIVGPRASPERLIAAIASLLGATGLVVVLAGLHGVLSYLVSRRAREIGMRLALGATPRRVLMMVLRQGLAPVVVGVVSGATLAMLLRRSLAAGLFLPAPETHVVLFASVPVLMLLTTAVACYFPARRASRIDPASALKQ